MNSVFNYKVYPRDLAALPKFPSDEGKSSVVDFLAIIGVIIMVVGLIWAIVNFFIGGYGWLGCLALWIIVIILFNVFKSETNKEFKLNKETQQSEYYSTQLNNLLSKSNEIVNNILPYLEISAKKSLDIARNDFDENAISPFWDKIEEVSKYLALYKEAIDQLHFNGEVYSRILYEKKHNFPLLFPIRTNISISDSVLDEFNQTIRKALSNFEFANIWEHRKTQKIIIAGFQTLGQAIDNMKEEIICSISSLEYSIQSGFREIKNIQLEQTKSFESSQNLINNTLMSMDKKLYYIQYNKKPTTPFMKPLTDY
ncbi:MAG: hypothetical protein NTZ33_04885 [Bacteroidetes bacterium]|nr:hypothetical protein [Bacteroidota bacterium]